MLNDAIDVGEQPPHINNEVLDTIRFDDLIKS